MNCIERRQLLDLHERHAAALVLYARQWCRQPDDAVQEAMIQLTQQSPPPRDPVAWLYTTVRRRAMNLARAERRRSEHHRRAAILRDDWFTVDPPELLDTETLRQALETLDPLDRQIVVARVWGDLSFAQLAELVDRPISFVHRRYQSGLKTLQRRLSSDPCKRVSQP